MNIRDFDKTLWQKGIKVKPKTYSKYHVVRAVDFEKKLIYIYGQNLPLLPKEIEYVEIVGNHIT